MEYLHRVQHANKGCILLFTPGPVPFWDLHVFLCWHKSLLSRPAMSPVRFPWNICNGCSMPTKHAYSSLHLALSRFGTYMCSYVDTSLSSVSLPCLRTLTCEHLSVLLICFVVQITMVKMDQCMSTHYMLHLFTICMKKQQMNWDINLLTATAKKCSVRSHTMYLKKHILVQCIWQCNLYIWLGITPSCITLWPGD